MVTGEVLATYQTTCVENCADICSVLAKGSDAVAFTVVAPNHSVQKSVR